MSGRRAMFGLCLICAFALSAVAAQGASASNGLTAFTCAEVAAGTGEFTKAHCKESDKGTGNYEHVGFEGETEITGSNETTNGESEVSRLKETISGVALELTSTSLTGSGTMENGVNGAGEHYTRGTGVITYSNVVVAKPASRECTAYENNGGSKGTAGVINTNGLAATSEGQGDSLLFTPASGNVFATFFIECNKPVAALEGLWEIEGEVSGTVDGATVNFTHAATTGQGTLIGKGHVSGLEGTLTIKGRANSGESYTALSSTTVET